MDVTDIIEPLNDAQRAAVTAEEIPSLVLAGAGSGKTRVLVHRIAWLIRVVGIAPQHLLAVTFTNKAATEMRRRIEDLLGMPTQNLWIGTFHGLAHRFLRRHWHEAGLAEGFQIMDSDDQQRLIKRMIRGIGLDEDEWAPREVQWFINAQKDEGLRPGDVSDDGNAGRRRMIDLYGRYERLCAENSVIDFAELLLRTLELLRDNEELLTQYQRRFRHVLVDEFQDTNAIQYQWLRLLTGSEGIPFIVGDDDQSIYRWRGARVENLFEFQKHYPGVNVVRLEQNYRSTKTILSAANAVIENNSARLGKRLWTDGERGDPIQLYAAFNERDEAEFVINRIQDHIEKGGRRDETAVLYRSNAQSRVFEEALLRAGIPYRVYGGLRFFERAEVKDALAYLRLIANRDDDSSFERVVNTPTRGIGARTLEQIRGQARAAGSSLWRASGAVISDGTLAKRSGQALWAFLRLIDDLDEETRDMELAEQVRHVIDRSGLPAHFAKDGVTGEARIENLDELVNAAQEPFDEEESDGSPLLHFLSYAVLESGDGQAQAYEDAVQLMTLHSAKGLEFPMLFLCGLEDGLFPHQRSIADADGLEEERRLCYVGITRARRKLYMTYAEQRRLYGTESITTPSRFIREIPTEFIEEVRPQMRVSRPVYRPRQKTGPIEDNGGYRLGRRVRHGKYGDGVILNVEGGGAHARVHVNFEAVGTKVLVVAYANLELM